MTIKDKFEAAVSDTDLLFDLYQADSLDMLGILFSRIYIPELIYHDELTRLASKRKDVSLDAVMNAIDSRPHLFEVVYEKNLDTVIRLSKRSLYQERIDLAGPGEVECAAYANASDIRYVVSNNTSEFRYLNDIAVMLCYYHVLSVCVFHNKMSESEATEYYNRISQVKGGNAHTFEVKMERSWDYFCDREYLDVLRLDHLAVY